MRQFSAQTRRDFTKIGRFFRLVNKKAAYFLQRCGQKFNIYEMRIHFVFSFRDKNAHRKSVIRMTPFLEKKKAPVSEL